MSGAGSPGSLPGGALPTLKEWIRSSGKSGDEGVVAFARFLRTWPLTAAILPAYLEVFEIGSPEAIGVLLQDKDPFSVFAQIPHTGKAVDRVLEILSGVRPLAAAEPVVLPLLGILQSVYGTGKPPAGITRPITVSDVNQVGKLLLAGAVSVREAAQSILEALTEADGLESAASLHSRRVLDAFLDHSKGVQTVIPRALLG